MAKVMTHTGERSQASAASLSAQAGWILLGVSVVVLTVMAISVPHLVGGAGWLTRREVLVRSTYCLSGRLGFVRVLRRRCGNRNCWRARWRSPVADFCCTRWRSWCAGRVPGTRRSRISTRWCWCSPGRVVALHEVAEWKFELPFLGAITVPIAALALVLMQVLPGEIRPLVPALQSTWLQIHVTLAMLSYAGFTISFAVALLYLIKDGATTRSFLSWSAALVLGVYGTIVATCCEQQHGADHAGLGFHGAGESDAGPPAGAAGADRCARLAVCDRAGTRGRHPRAEPARDVLRSGPNAGRTWRAAPSWPRSSRQALSLVLLLLKVNAGPYYVPQYGQSFGVHLAESPFLLAGVVTALFASLAWEVLRLEIRLPRRLPTQPRHAGRVDLQDRGDFLSPADPDDHRRRLLGQSHLGVVLELGPEGRLGADHLAHLRGLPPHAVDARLARTALGVLRHHRLRHRDVHLLRRHLPAAGTACIRVSEKQKAGDRSQKVEDGRVGRARWFPDLKSCASGSCAGGRSFSSDGIGPHTVGGFKPLKLQGLKAPSEVLAIVGPEGPTPFLEFTPPY